MSTVKSCKLIPGLHSFDERHSVGHHIIPLRVVPGGLSAALPVSHALVAPDVVDGVQLSQLGEQASVGNVRPHVGPELDTLGPVVTPVIHRAWLQ